MVGAVPKQSVRSAARPSCFTFPSDSSLIHKPDTALNYPKTCKLLRLVQPQGVWNRLNTLSSRAYNPGRFPPTTPPAARPSPAHVNDEIPGLEGLGIPRPPRLHPTPPAQFAPPYVHRSSRGACATAFYNYSGPDR